MRPRCSGNPNMLAISLELARCYEARLAQQNRMAGQRPHDHQWLRYYLDCCDQNTLSLPA